MLFATWIPASLLKLTILEPVTTIGLSVVLICVSSNCVSPSTSRLSGEKFPVMLTLVPCKFRLSAAVILMFPVLLVVRSTSLSVASTSTLLAPAIVKAPSSVLTVT